MKKLILDNVLVVEIDEAQEMELAELFPDLQEALAADSEVRVEIMPTTQFSSRIDAQLEQLEEMALEIERNLHDLGLPTGPSIRPD